MAAPTVATIGNAKPVVTGGILVAPLGTELPTDIDTAPGAAFTALGYVNEDGLQPEGERNVETIRDWGGDIIAQLQTEHSSRFKFTLYAVFDPAVLKAVFGDANVTVTGNTITVNETGEELPHNTWLFDMRSTGGKKVRIGVADGQVTTAEEQPMVAGELQAFEVTVEAYTADGVKVTRLYEGETPVVEGLSAPAVEAGSASAPVNLSEDDDA